MRVFQRPVGRFCSSCEAFGVLVAISTTRSTRSSIGVLRSKKKYTATSVRFTTKDYILGYDCQILTILNP
jgi:hypothetical protein